MKRKFTDPIGPGTPAWNYFDKALEAWQDWREARVHWKDKVPKYKRYVNCRQHMIGSLKKAKASSSEIELWCKQLAKRRKEVES